MNDTIKITGEVLIEMTGQDGVLKSSEVTNLVVNVGKEHLAALLANSAGPTEMTRMALGTGTTTAEVTQTALVTEISRKVVDSRTQNSRQCIYVASWVEGEATSVDPPITEAGIFNATSGGDMLCRTTFNGKAKGAGDSITLTWTITIS